MKVLAASLVALFVIMTAPLAAQDPDGNLVGTWEMTDIVGRSWNGAKMTSESLNIFELEITEHDGPIFAGKLRWQFVDDQHQLDDGKQIASASEEDVLAIKDFDGIYVLVEHPDHSIHRIKITGADTLQMVSYETGPGAAVGFATFRRK